MAQVRETKLPGVGVRREFATEDGTVLGVIEHHTGRTDVAIYDRADPDRCSAMLHLSAGDTHTLATLLGASQITESMGDVVAQIEGLLFQWIDVPAESPTNGHTIGEGQFRTRTGASIVAIIRAGSSVPAPGPEHRIEAGDTIVAVGTLDGLTALKGLLAP